MHNRKLRGFSLGERRRKGINKRKTRPEFVNITCYWREHGYYGVSGRDLIYGVD
jgi:hypothetical protein